MMSWMSLTRTAREGRQCAEGETREHLSEGLAARPTARPMESPSPPAWRPEERHIPAPKPDNEVERLRFTQSLQVFDTVPDESIDEITLFLSGAFKVPIVLVSIVDAERQWFKSRVGLEASETPREVSFCAHTFIPESPEVLLVSDATKDPRFHHNALVLGPPFIRFYC